VRTLSLLLAVAALCACAHVSSAKKVLGTKLRSQNKVYKVDKSTDLEMCKAIIREMHTELIKHKMREDGEDNIYDTAGMAICLGVVQNYTFEEDTATKVWKLTRKENPDEDALFGGFGGAGGDDEASAKMVEGLLMTKKACMDFAEELQLEISEVMYGRVHEASGEEIAQEFCPNAVKPVKREKTKYVPATSAKERAQSDPGALMTEMLQKRDTSGVVSEMLETEASFPERMLDPPLQAEIAKGAVQLTCQVCKAAVRQAHSRVQEVAKTPAFKDKWQRQSLVAEAITHICHGKDYEKLQAGYYPSVPGNPPEWAFDYYLTHTGGEYKMKKGKAGVATMKAFIKSVSPPGEQDSEESDSDEEDFDRSRAKHEYDVMRQAIIRTACKSAIDQRLDTEEGDLAELLLEKRQEAAKSVASAYCQPVCRRQGPSDEL